MYSFPLVPFQIIANESFNNQTSLSQWPFVVNLLPVMGFSLQTGWWKIQLQNPFSVASFWDYIWLELPNLSNINTGLPVKTGFQINTFLV